jgi:DNA-directed RNA polymerase specialized sigma subunit
MIQITAQQIADAKANDMAAVTAVLAEMEARVMQHANRYATVTGGHTDHHLRDDLAQIGRVAVWQAIEKFSGTDVAQFFVYVDRTLSGEMNIARRESTRPGVSASVARDFESALSRSGGDAYAAETLAASDAMGTAKMSRETALAARMAWQGCANLDTPVGEDGDTLGDMIPDDLRTTSDVISERRRETAKAVHAALGKLSSRHSAILKGTFGIDGPTPYFGTTNEDEFAAYFGMARRTDLSAARSKAKARFRTVYLAGNTQITA